MIVKGRSIMKEGLQARSFELRPSNGRLVL